MRLLQLPMRPAGSKDALLGYLRRLGGPEDLPVAGLITAAMRFYLERPATGLAPGPGSDMILFQYGCYDWGEGEWFELDLTRQFIVLEKEDDDAISQLECTALFRPDEVLREMGNDNRWCESRADFDGFERAVLASRPLTVLANRKPDKVRVHWGEV